MNTCKWSVQWCASRRIFIKAVVTITLASTYIIYFLKLSSSLLSIIIWAPFYSVIQATLLPLRSWSWVCGRSGLCGLEEGLSDQGWDGAGGGWNGRCFCSLLNFFNILMWCGTVVFVLFFYGICFHLEVLWICFCLFICICCNVAGLFGEVIVFDFISYMTRIILLLADMLFKKTKLLKARQLSLSVKHVLLTC